MKTKKLMKITLVSLSIFCICCLISGCQATEDGNKNTYENGKLTSINVGEKLPNVLVSNLGLGELEKVNDNEYDLSWINEETPDYSLISKDAYKNPDNKKAFIVCRWKNKTNLTLEQFTRTKVVDYGMGLTNYNIGKSSVYARANHNITDGYYAMLTNADNGNFNLGQQSVYQDGDNFVTLSYVYKCTKYKIEDSKVGINIPIIDEAIVSEYPYGSSSKRFSFEEKTEIPTITYYKTNKTLDEALSNYKSSYSANTDKAVINGITCGVAKEPNATVDGKSLNMITCFVPDGNKVVAIEISEPTDKPTYAFDALFNGIFVEK